MGLKFLKKSVRKVGGNRVRHLQRDKQDESPIHRVNASRGGDK